jgi:hypothetical protein
LVDQVEESLAHIAKNVRWSSTPKRHHHLNLLFQAVDLSC